MAIVSTAPQQRPTAANLVLRSIVVVNFVLLLLVAVPPFDLAVQEALRRMRLETAFQVWILGSTMALPVILVVESLQRFVATRRTGRTGDRPPSIFNIWIDLLVVAVYLVALVIVLLQRVPLG